MCRAITYQYFHDHVFRKESVQLTGASSECKGLLKEKIRRMTKRNRGVSLETVISELNKTLRGWINYFQLTQ